MTLKLNGSTDGSVSINAPADTSPSGSDITLTLPTTVGSANQFVKNGGTAGELEYSSMVEDSSGNCGIGTTSPESNRRLTVDIGTTSSNVAVFKSQDTGGGSYIGFMDKDTTNGNRVRVGAINDSMAFITAGAEAARFDSSGRLLVNKTGSPSEGEGSEAPVFIQGNTNSGSGPAVLGLARGQSASEISGGASLGIITFTDDAGNDFAEIKGATDGGAGSGDHPGRLTFLTTPNNSSSPTERMRIQNDGRIGIANTLSGTQDLSGSRLSVYGNSSAATGSVPMAVHTANVASERYMIVFFNGNGNVGNIRTNGSSTSYNTSSDYRLKENVVGITDGITRVKQLQPKRFNFIADADTTVDGFLAHEAQAVVPEAISGTHNQVQVWDESEELPNGVSVGDNKLDEDGNTIPEYQSIDQSKLVPLLTAALQEAIAKIETLEAKVAALEAAE